MSTNGYRNTSTASTTSSTNSMRPSSRQHGLRQVNGRPPSAADNYAAVEEAEAEAGVMGKRKGTPIMSFNPLHAITMRKTRLAEVSRNQHQPPVDARSQRSGSYIRSLSSSTCSSSGEGRNCGGNSSHLPPAQRTTSTISSSSLQQEGTNGVQQSRHPSLISAFAELSLTPKPLRNTSAPKSATKHTPSLSPVKESSSPSKIPKYSCTPRLRHAQSSQAVLSTPSPLKQKHSASGLRTPASSAFKRGGGGNSTIRDEIPVFLTKEKLTPSSIPAWDTKGRLEDMERLYATLRFQFESAADSKNALEQSLQMYKDRGEGSL
jgi:hypothetical protein